MAGSEQAAGGGTQISLEHLRALSDEMLALSRAGVPLHEGLRHLGQDLPGRLGRAATELSQRLEQGQPIEQSLGPEQGVPEAFSTLLAVGARSGRLALALEGITTLLMRAADTRRMILASLLYPLIVGGLALWLFAFMLAKPMRVALQIYRDAAPDSVAWRPIDFLARTRDYWTLGIPLLVLVVLAFWWWRSGRAGYWEHGTGGFYRRRTRCSFRNLVRNARLAIFADSLALMIEHEIPLAEALELAAATSGERALRDSATAAAARLRRGEAASQVVSGLPPVVSCLLRTEPSSPRLVATLRRAAEGFREDAEFIHRWLAQYFPIWLTVGVGGVTTLVYSVTLIWPWADFLYVISLP
jgi:type II secretory pathway component PulF